LLMLMGNPTNPKGYGNGKDQGKGRPR
jgi:hypothetical protein